MNCQTFVFALKSSTHTECYGFSFYYWWWKPCLQSPLNISMFLSFLQFEHDDFTGSQSSLDCVRVISINFISLPTFLGLEIKKNCWLFFRFVTLHASCIYFLRQPYWFEPMSIPSIKHCATFILIRKLDDLCSYITKWPVYRIHILSTKFGEPI